MNQIDRKEVAGFVVALESNGDCADIVTTVEGERVILADGLTRDMTPYFKVFGIPEVKRGFRAEVDRRTRALCRAKDRVAAAEEATKKVLDAWIRADKMALSQALDRSEKPE